MAAWSGLGISATQPSAFWSDFTEEVGAPYVGYVTENFSRVRIISQINSATSIAACHTWALQLKAAKPSLKILYGATWNGLSDTNQSEYHDGIMAEAQWAMDNGMDEFQISNETENNKSGSISDADIRIFLRSLATDVKAVFTRPICYAVAQGREDGWISEGRGDLDKIAFNIYGHSGAYNSFVALLQKVYDAFGDNCFISEWNVNPAWLDTSINGITPVDSSFDEVYGSELIRRLNAIISIGFDEAYFFHLWSFSASFGIDYFSLFTLAEAFRPGALRLMGQRSPYITT